jgi:hypothetical protein
MPTQSRKRSVATQIEKKILKVVPKPRLPLAKKKKTPARVAMNTRERDKGWKTIVIDPDAWPLSLMTSR